MVRFKFWRRKKHSQEDSNLPDEVQEYYQSTRRERVGVAWMLALVTAVVTLVIALTLFFGGRWAFERFFGEDEPTEITQEDIPPEDHTLPGPTEEDEVEDDEEPREEEERDEPEPEDRPEPTDEPSPEPDEPTQPPLEEQPTGDEAPVTGQEIPDTGPGSGLAVFAAASLSGMLGYYALQFARNRSSR